jgi:hypothetical protein
MVKGHPKEGADEDVNDLLLMIHTWLCAVSRTENSRTTNASQVVYFRFAAGEHY